MALDSLRTTISPETTFKYIEKVEQKDGAYSFSVRPLGPKIELQLNREVRNDPLRVYLHSDGTWTAEHILVVGER